MKYTIDGFSQKAAIEMGLNCEDLVILRWFTDFCNSDKMVKIEHQGKLYCWVNYKGFLEQMPIISCNKRNLAKKFKRLVDADVLVNKTIKEGGSFSTYRFGKNYSLLICTDDATVDQKQTTPMSENEQPLCSEIDNQNTHLLKNNHLLENSFIGNQEKENRGKRFVPPTLEEVEAYCKERANGIDAHKFINYYETRGWKLKSGKMKNWKAAVRTWEGNQKEYDSKNANASDKKFGELDNYTDSNGETNWNAHNGIDANEFWYRFENNAQVYVSGMELTNAFDSLWEEYPKKIDKQSAAKSFFEFVKENPKEKMRDLVINMDTYIKHEKDKGDNWEFYVSMKKFIEERQYTDYPQYNYDVFINGKQYETKQEYVNAILSGEIKMYCLPSNFLVL